jgi:hypothetical protein
MPEEEKRGYSYGLCIARDGCAGLCGGLFWRWGWCDAICEI